MDYTQNMFFAKQLRKRKSNPTEETSYGLVRYATLDVSNLQENQLEGFIEKLIAEAENIGLCNFLQLAGFNKNGRRYLIISGDDTYQQIVRGSISQRIRNIKEKLPIEYVKEHIIPPI